MAYLVLVLGWARRRGKPAAGCQEPEQGRCQLSKILRKSPPQSAWHAGLGALPGGAGETLHVRLHGAEARP
ncbi:hypothetical protein C4K40_2263 [Pseudomonas sp. CMR5c]|nr:hypothetical protein C4K40_2263 [Pseudomonas sp. CMR5c]